MHYTLLRCLHALHVHVYTVCMQLHLLMLLRLDVTLRRRVVL